MAEVLGIVAGATQLLDLSARVLLASSQLYSKLKNVPDEIETLKKSTQQFIDLLRIISLDFSVPAGSRSDALKVSHHVTSILHDAIKESGELARLLEDLSTSENSAVKRTWAAVVSAKKERELTERCRRVESFKSSLQLWHQHQSTVRLQQQLNQITTYQLALQSSMGLLTQECSTITNSNQDIVARLSSFNLPGPPSNGLTRRRRRRPPLGSNGCTCSPWTQSTTVSFSALQLFLTKQDCHSKTCPYRDNSTSWSCGLRTLSPRIQVMLGLQLGGWALSMCGRISPHNVVDPEKSPAFVAVKHAFQEIQDTFNVSFYLSWPLPGSKYQVVESDSLKTVMAVREVDVLQQQAVTSIFEKLLRNILQAFESGEASPTDQTPQGATVLHWFIFLAAKCVYFQEQNYSLLDGIAEILFAGNVDPNADICSKEELERLLDLSYHGPDPTLLCIMVRESFRPWYPLDVSEHIRLDRILVKHGCDTSRALQDGQRSGHRRINSIITRNSLLLEGEHSPLRAAVIERSENELRHLVSIEEDGIDDKGLVRLAVGWLTGLRILLDAGADPVWVIFDAIRERELPSIELLLDYDCPMFFDGDRYDDIYRGGLVEYALQFYGSPGVVALLIEKLAERRKNLLRLALENLPDACLKKLGYGKEQGKFLVDRHALQIFEELQMHHVQAPRALWPGKQATVYHSYRMPSTVARKLYHAGFRDINEPDDDGITPLLTRIICGFCVNFEVTGRCPDRLRLLEWYLGQGATLSGSPNFQTILQFSETYTGSVSAGIWIGEHRKLCGPLQVFRQLDEQTAHQPDNCSCWCTTAGCTPVGIVLRKEQWWKAGSRQVYQLLRRRRWLFYLPRYSSLGLSVSQQCFADICRLEVFDRLGMAHTCCQFLDQDRLNPKVDLGEMIRGGTPSIPLEERQELQEEDQYLKPILDSYVDLYLDLQNHRGGFENFWISWWLALEDHLPHEIPEDQETEYTRIELAGVLDLGTLVPDQDLSSYDPNIEAITNIVKEYSLYLNAEGIGKVLDQLAPDRDEQDFNELHFEGWLSRGGKEEED